MNKQERIKINQSILDGYKPKESSAVALLAAAIGVGIFAIGSKYVNRAVAARNAMKNSASNMNTTKSGTSNFFGSWGKRYYEGGFEDKMTRREASRILGCRASATKERINKRYRILMRLNHPDLGGSPFLTAKVNEAKVLL